MKIDMQDNTEKDVLIKRLLAAMSLGFYIDHADGHRWIMADLDQLNERLNLSLDCYPFSAKCYGGVNECLDRIDEFLKNNGNETLVNHWGWIASGNTNGNPEYVF